MWRLLPLLAVLCFLEILVPWPDVAALVLSHATQSGVHAVSPHPLSPRVAPGNVGMIPSERHSLDASRDPSRLLLQARVTSP